MKKNSISPANVKRSADPRSKYWNAIHKKVIGRGSSLESSSLDSVATLMRLISTIAAIAMAMMDKTRPVPMRWRCVIPVSDRVTLRANGTMVWSYNGTMIMMKRTGKTGREAGGTLKEARFVFMVAACWTENVESWARQELRIMVEVKIGRIFTTIFTSSTCCTEQLSLDGLA